MSRNIMLHRNIKELQMMNACMVKKFGEIDAPCNEHTLAYME
jgi:hypothetical protein